MKWAIIVFIVSVFVVTGALLPFLNTDFNTTYSGLDADSYVGNYQGGDSLTSIPLGAGRLFVSIVSMFFWSFGALPLPLELIFVIMRIIFVFILVDLLWIG
jgi:hypothetical protein